MSLLSTLFGKKTDYSGRIAILDLAAYKEALDGGNVQLIDVRTSREFNAGHIQGAVNMDIFQGRSFQSAASKMDMQNPVYVYCRSGARSQKAARKLVKMGFTQIYDLKGGYIAWTQP